MRTERPLVAGHRGVRAVDGYPIWCVMASQGPPGTGTPRDGHFTVSVRLLPTGEKFLVPDCSPRMSVGSLKERLEVLAGVPITLQALSYLDDGDMPDTTSLRFNGIFPGAKLTMNIWKYDRIDELVKFAAAGELEKLKTMGVTQDSAFITANSARLTVKQRKEWLAARAGLGLYVATHRGHLNVLRFLIQNGCNVQYKTCCGNTPLHVAAAMGNVDCMSELLANGAQPQDTNQNGHTALDLARLCGQKTTERRLYLFNWEKRSANAPPIKTHLDSSELFAHQKFDSKLKTWRNGTYAKRYMANLISYPEFHGSHFSAPPKKIPDKK